MPRILAIEWDSREARVVAANARTGGLTVEQMFNVSLAAAEGESAAPKLGSALSAALSDRRLGKSPAIIALSRSQVELKQLTLPPAPDEELAEMVRLQAMREFTSLGDEWPLDYLPLSDSAEAQREVLAAAASPETMQQVSQACEAAGLDLSHVALRPMAAASLLLRNSEARGYAVPLLIDLLPGEAGLTVIAEGRVVFTRTARLGGEVLGETAEARPLISEIRRTLAAVHNQLQDRRVEAVFLLGATPAHETLARRINDELALPCRAIDPLERVSLGRELKQSPVDDSGRYAALVGLLLDEAETASPALDFLNPRKPPPPPSRKREFAIAGLAACALALLIAVVIFFVFRGLDNQIAALDGELQDYQRIADSHADAQKEIAPFEDALASDFVWLDELAKLAEEYPRGDQVMYTQILMRSHPFAGQRLRKAKDDFKKRNPRKDPAKEMPPLRVGGGEITLDGVAKRSVQQSDLRWQDERRDMRVPIFRQDGKHPLYPTTFRAVIQLGPREPDYRPAKDASKAESEKAKKQ